MSPTDQLGGAVLEAGVISIDMLNFFRRKEKSEPTAAQPGAEAQKQAAIAAGMKSVIKASKKKDPLVGLKLGAKEVNSRLINGLKTEKGVHIESFLTVLGALSGFACQMSVRAEVNRKKLRLDQVGWVMASGADGIIYFFGDGINKPLAESEHSVWSLAAGAAEHLGGKVPDVNQIFAHVAATVGGEQFGIPRIPDGHTPGDLPLNYLKVIWPSVFPVAIDFCEEPGDLPVLFGLAIQQALEMAGDVIDPGLAVTIVMECAIPMSKMDLPELYAASSTEVWNFQLPALP